MVSIRKERDVEGKHIILEFVPSSGVVKFGGHNSQV